MAEILLVRQPDVQMTEHDMECARRFIFGLVDGLGEQNKRRWRRFWSMLWRMVAGEIATVVTHKDRSTPYHRRHMKIEQTVFEAQERIAEFEQFRYWLKVGAGFVDWLPGPKGAVVPFPKSIAYDRLEQAEMQEFHDNAIAFLRTEHAAKCLWPHMPAAQRAQAIEAVLSEFNE